MSANRLLVIGRRFCGPPGSGNGGYTCGMLAASAAKPVEVRLMRPPPLDKALAIRTTRPARVSPDGWREMVASATPKTFELVVPKAPPIRGRSRP